MTRNSFDRLVHAFAARQPWKPFTLELLSGSRVEVNHPEALNRQGDIFACKSTSGMRCYFECTAVIRFIDGTGT